MPVASHYQTTAALAGMESEISSVGSCGAAAAATAVHGGQRFSALWPLLPPGYVQGWPFGSRPARLSLAGCRAPRSCMALLGSAGVAWRGPVSAGAAWLGPVSAGAAGFGLVSAGAAWLGSVDRGAGARRSCTARAGRPVLGQRTDLHHLQYFSRAAPPLAATRPCWPSDGVHGGPRCRSGRSRWASCERSRTWRLGVAGLLGRVAFCPPS